MEVRRVWMQDGAGGIAVELPGSFPMDRRGVLVRYIEGTAPGPGAELFRVSGPPVRERVDEEFMIEPFADLAAMAFLMAASSRVLSVVVCPTGVPQEATALAALVGARLHADLGRAVVTCGVRLPASAFEGGRRVQRPVVVEDGDGGETRQVWELGAVNDLRGLLRRAPRLAHLMSWRRRRPVTVRAIPGTVGGVVR